MKTFNPPKRRLRILGCLLFFFLSSFFLLDRLGMLRRLTVLSVQAYVEDHEIVMLRTAGDAPGTIPRCPCWVCFVSRSGRFALHCCIALKA